MLKKIYAELIAIRKELQAIRISLESRNAIQIDGREFSQSVGKAIRDSV